MNHPDLACPECHSDQTQSISVIHASGTVLSHRFPPPMNRPIFKSTHSVRQWGRAAFFGLPVVLLALVSPLAFWRDERGRITLFAWPALAVAAVICLAAWVRYFFTIYLPWFMACREAGESVRVKSHWWWERTYFCHRCGKVFVPDHLLGVEPFNQPARPFHLYPPSKN